MKKLFYPAWFRITKDGAFTVSFPDIPDCLAKGNDLTQAYEMAVDALGLALSGYEKERKTIPSSSLPTMVRPLQDAFLVVIEFDMLAYKKRTNPKAVKKTLSIPQWMNEAAMDQGLNFSQVLQEAIMQKIKI